MGEFTERGGLDCAAVCRRSLSSVPIVAGADSDPPDPSQPAWRQDFSVNYRTDIESVAFSPDGRWLAICTYNLFGLIRLFDIGSGNRIWRYRELLTPLDVVVFSPSRQLLATGGSTDGRARILDATSGRRLSKTAAKGGWVSAMVFSPDGRRLATARGSGLDVLNVTTGRRQLTVSTRSPRHSAITCMAFSPDGSRLAIAEDVDDAAWVWDAYTGQQQLQLLHAQHVSGVTFSPDGQQLATSADDGTVRIWDARIGRQQLQLHHGNAMTRAVFSRNGHQIATCGDDDTVRIWHAHTGQQQSQLPSAGLIPTMAFVPGNRLLVAATDHMTVSIRSALVTNPVASTDVAAICSPHGPVASVRSRSGLVRRAARR